MRFFIDILDGAHILMGCLSYDSFFERDGIIFI